jgi:hypothetical protein
MTDHSQMTDSRQSSDQVDNKHLGLDERVPSVPISSSKLEISPDDQTLSGSQRKSLDSSYRTEPGGRSVEKNNMQNTTKSGENFEDKGSVTADVRSLKNLLPPDAAHSSSDLEHFMPTEQVFSEREELLREEIAVSTFQDRAISVPFVPGALPTLPPSLKVMAFPRGDVTDFPRPQVGGGNYLSE